MIQLKGIKKVYNVGERNQFVALDNISLEIGDNELVAIVGESGAGKSTLMHILGCIDIFQEGEMCIDGERINPQNERKLAQIRNKKMGIVLQDFGLIQNFTVLENVEIPLVFAGYSKKKRRQISLDLLNEVSMKKYAEKQVMQLSGGQKQRVAFSRALANDPSYILADEPTGSLDSKTGYEVMQKLLKLHYEGKTVIIVTHNEKIAEMCNRKIVISDGHIVSDVSK